MSTRRFGRIERLIEREIERDRRIDVTGKPGVVNLHSWGLLCDAYPERTGSGGAIPGDDTYFKFTPAQRKAVIRAMHTYVAKHQQFALMGGQGRKMLYLYEPDDLLSAAWAKLCVETKGFVHRGMAEAYLREQQGIPPSDTSTPVYRGES